MNSTDEFNYTFGFDEVYQAAVLGYMLDDREFLLRCKTVIPYKLFTNPYVSGLVHILYDHFDKFRELPASVNEFEVLISNRFHGDFLVQKKHKETLTYCVVVKEKFNFKVLMTTMTGWIKLVKIKEMISKATDLYNNRQFDEALGFSKLSVAKIEEASFIGTSAVPYTSLVDFYRAMREELATDCCTIGHPDFDEMLREGTKIKDPSNPADIRTTTRGSLAPGQTTVLIGSSNSGKTTTVQSIIAHNVVFGKFVLEITLEQTDSELKDKLVRCLSGLAGTTLSSLDVDPSIVATVSKSLAAVTELLSVHLTHHHWIKADDMYVESIISLVMIEQEKMMAKEIRDPSGKVIKPKGKGYDLLVCDYPGKLGVRNIGGRNWKTHEEKGYVYDQFVNTAKQYKFHALLPAQTNREGYKVNRGDADRMIDQGDAAFSFYIMQIADNVITLNRSPKDIARKIIKMYLAKSRTQATGTTFVSQTNMAISRTHGFNLVSAHSETSDGAEEAITKMLFAESKPAKDINTMPLNLVAAPAVGPAVAEPVIIKDAQEEPAGVEALPDDPIDPTVDEELVATQRATAAVMAEEEAVLAAQFAPVVPNFIGTSKPQPLSDDILAFLEKEDSTNE